MNDNEILLILKNNSSEEQRLFSTKIINSQMPVIGVKTPIIKTLAKTYAKENEDLSLITWHKYVEVDLLIGMTNMFKKISENEKYAFLDVFLDGVDNWAVIDQVSSAFKTKKIDLALDFIKNCLSSPHSFKRRFGYIHFLSNFVKNKDYLQEFFSLLKNDESYYVEMAEAWLISVAYIYFPEMTFDFLKYCNLDKFIVNKSISKIRDSFRVEPMEKERLLALRRSN